MNSILKITLLIFTITIGFNNEAFSQRFLKKYKKAMIKNPSTQAEKDKNLILEYLISNKLKFESTESGIYYSISKEGTGGHPDSLHMVNTHYKGYRLDGKIFDSSYDRGEPITFPLNGVIKGWQEAIPLLKKGGKGTFIIPSHLAYGVRGAGADIPPNTVLIFDVELMDFYREEEKVARQKKIDQENILKYLKDNGLKAEKTLSGIHYIIEKAGSGAEVKETSFVKVHYKGSLLNGKVFDSSYERNEPSMFPLNRVVKGWQEAIPLLKKGGKGKFLIPSHLAYGERGAGEVIPPNSVLVFEVELLDVMTEEQLLQTQSEAAEQQKIVDDNLIQKYIKDNNLKAKKTAEGVYYILDEEGSSAKPNIKSQVTVHYEGSLLDGNIFDSSFQRGEPATFPLSGVVKGWQIGIPQFGKGGKGTILIPSHLGYGSRGAGASIPPNSVLIFKVEIIDFK